MSENGYSYTITRTLDAPVAKVWAAWTTPDQYAAWAHAKPGSVEQDVRPGGAWRATMVTPDGTEIPLTGSYVEVVEDKRLTVGMDMPGRDEPATMGIDLADAGGRTEITVSQTCDTPEERDMSEAGSNMLLDGLASFVAGP